MGKVEQCVYKLRPPYKHNKLRPTYKHNSIILWQIHVLDDEYKAISKKQKISETGRDWLLEIDKQTAT